MKSWSEWVAAMLSLWAALFPEEARRRIHSLRRTFRLLTKLRISKPASVTATVIRANQPTGGNIEARSVISGPLVQRTLLTGNIHAYSTLSGPTRHP